MRTPLLKNFTIIGSDSYVYIINVFYTHINKKKGHIRVYVAYITINIIIPNTNT